MWSLWGGRKTFSTKRYENAIAVMFVCTKIAVPNELSENPNISVLLMLISCILLYPQFVFYNKCYTLLTGSDVTVLKVRLNQTVHSKDRFRRGWGNFPRSRGWMVSNWVNTLRTGLLNCLNVLSRGLTVRHRASCI